MREHPIDLRGDVFPSVGLASDDRIPARCNASHPDPAAAGAVDPVIAHSPASRRDRVALRRDARLVCQLLKHGRRETLDVFTQLAQSILDLRVRSDELVGTRRRAKDCERVLTKFARAGIAHYLGQGHPGRKWLWGHGGCSFLRRRPSTRTPRGWSSLSNGSDRTAAAAYEHDSRTSIGSRHSGGVQNSVRAMRSSGGQAFC